MTPSVAAAALSAGLLARKGDAAPVTLALRPHAICNPTATDVPRLATATPNGTAAGNERAGQRLRQWIRLDPQRHLQLRLMAAHLGTSRQELLLRAFDEFLDRHAVSAFGRRCRCLEPARQGLHRDAVESKGSHDGGCCNGAGG
jgi:hypothetical protein